MLLVAEGQQQCGLWWVGRIDANLTTETISNKDPAMAFLDMIGGVSLNEPGTPLEFGSGSFGGGGDGSGCTLFQPTVLGDGHTHL